MNNRNKVDIIVSAAIRTLDNQSDVRITDARLRDDDQSTTVWVHVGGQTACVTTHELRAALEAAETAVLQ